MGTYLYSVDALAWFECEDEYEGGYGHVAKALNAELVRHGLPTYAPPATEGGSGGRDAGHDGERPAFEENAS